jgi:hypothetical protein
LGKITLRQGETPKNHDIHRMHCIKQRLAVAQYWKLFFMDRFLRDITTADIDAFINHMGDMNLSAARKNNVILAGTKPLRWAFSKGKIVTDPTGDIFFFRRSKRTLCVITSHCICGLPC